MSRKRQLEQSEVFRRRILDIARRIVSDEGVEALSIRRITKEMDYSAGSVYHYFENKEQILSCVLREGYAKIMKSILPIDENLTPDDVFRSTWKRFIKSVLKNPDEYKAIMLSSSAQVLEFTSVLRAELCKKHPALSALVSTLEAGISKGIFSPCDTEITAQAIWSAMFGLIIRLIIEKNVAPKQRAKLIERQIELILRGLRK